jgi:hypothetical protein
MVNSKLPPLSAALFQQYLVPTAQTLHNHNSLAEDE